jgi:polynucleotide 5'-hydroxyl-kinase GRC3/NOL9
METVTQEDWYAVLDALSQEKGIAILLGAIDTGKTTFAKFLIDHLCGRRIKAALVDADIGQSSLGPPTTIGLSVFEFPPDWDTLSTPDIFFVGATTPEENLPLHLEGVKRMADRAFRSGAEIILVDTTGLVHGDLGRDLKRRKIDLLSPRFIFSLQVAGELEPILEPYRENPMIRIFRLSPSEHLRSRSREERRSYRTKKFQHYFKGSEVRELVTDQLSLEGKTTTSDGLPIPFDQVLSIRGLLVGLKDFQGETMALGLIESHQEGSRRVRVLTPLVDPIRVARLQLSPLRLLPSFEEERIG